MFTCVNLVVQVMRNRSECPAAAIFKLITPNSNKIRYSYY